MKRLPMHARHGLEEFMPCPPLTPTLDSMTSGAVNTAPPPLTILVIFPSLHCFLIFKNLLLYLLLLFLSSSSSSSSSFFLLLLRLNLQLFSFSSSFYIKFCDRQSPLL